MDEDHIKEARKALLLSAVEFKCKGNRRAFGRLLGYKSGSLVSQMLAGDHPITERTIRKIHQVQGLENWFAQAFDHTPIEDHQSRPVTLDEHTVTSLSWGELMKRVDELGDVFCAALRDGALAPDYPAGTRVVFDRRLTPEPDDVVLVRARSGELHARIYVQGKEAGQWSSNPLKPAFASFGSDDGAECLAVMVEAAIIRGRRSH